MKDTLFHINWGDGDNTYIIAPDRETARKRMSDGKDMINYVVKLDALYQMIFKAGRKEIVEWVDGNMWKQGSIERWQAQKKEWI